MLSISIFDNFILPPHILEANIVFFSLHYIYLLTLVIVTCNLHVRAFLYLFYQRLGKNKCRILDSIIGQPLLHTVYVNTINV